MPPTDASPIVLDSITHLTAAHRGCAVIAGSHGGAYAGYFAARMQVGAAIFNDAGVGRERAGVAGVDMLGRLGVPAAALAHTSARIGDGRDCHARGMISHVNGPAQRLGLAIGLGARDALDRLGAARLVPSPAPEPLSEARYEATDAAGRIARVIVTDSVTLVTPQDAGHILVNGSHGGLLGGRPETAIKVGVFAAVFNDAGIGIDGAGVTRLPALDARGIAGACVSAFSARIGDGRSIMEHGFVSAINATARRHGGAVGQSTRAFVAAMVAARDAVG